MVKLFPFLLLTWKIPNKIQVFTFQISFIVKLNLTNKSQTSTKDLIHALFQQTVLNLYLFFQFVPTTPQHTNYAAGYWKGQENEKQVLQKPRCKNRVQKGYLHLFLRSHERNENKKRLINHIQNLFFIFQITLCLLSREMNKYFQNTNKKQDNAGL